MANQNTLPLSDGVVINDPIPQTFQFDNSPVRLTDRDGQVWFNANDVCAVLEIVNSKHAISRLDDDEKSEVAITDSMGRQQTVNIISESGLYALVLTSRKAQAKRFKKWVTGEVLPQIRKTGSYIPPQTPKIEDKKRQKQLSSPNYRLASELAAMAAQAVFEAVNQPNTDWMRSRRLLLTINTKAKPRFKLLEDDAFITSPEKLTQLIAQGGGYTSQSQLVDLIQACLDQIAKYWLHKD